MKDSTSHTHLAVPFNSLPGRLSSPEIGWLQWVISQVATSQTLQVQQTDSVTGQPVNDSLDIMSADVGCSGHFRIQHRCIRPVPPVTKVW